MKVTKIRKDSLGLKGTYRNIKHHAETVRPIVNEMVKTIMRYKDVISEWPQGHNLHYLKSFDGRWLVFRPYSEDGEYVGVTVYQEHGSRNNRVPLFVVVKDNLQLFDSFLNAWLSTAFVKVQKG